MSPVQGRRLNVGNLAPTVSPDKLRKLFEKHGKVESVAICTDPDTGVQLGRAIVFMARPSDAATAVRMLNRTRFEHRTLFVYIGGSFFSDTDRFGPRMSAPRDEPTGGGLKLRAGIPAYRPPWLDD